MKKKEIPNFVFKRDYDYYYLYTELDIIFNEQFYENFNTFIREVLTESLIIRLDDISKFPNFINFKLEHLFTKPFNNELKLFHQSEINDFPIFYINHFVYDNSFQWEIFISVENEISIIGVDKSVNEIFKNIFEPYKDESIDVKLKIITDQFVDLSLKTQFINELKENYKFGNGHVSD